MEFYNFLLIILSVVTSASSKAFTFISPFLTEEVPKSLSRVKRDMKDCYRTDYVLLPTYSIYLIGFSMLFMLIAIVILAVALYLALKGKSIFRYNATNKPYVMQESKGVTPLYSTNYEEQNNGSTLTMNSGIIEISEPRVSDPTTPTRLEESKIIFAKRPLKAIVPVMHKGQMDAICKEVLRKVQKSDSASFRDLNEMLKFEKREDNFGFKSEDVKESEKENKKEEKAESQLLKLKKPEIKTETQKQFKTETQKEVKTETQNETKIKDEKIKETKQETKNKTKNKRVSEPKPDEIKDIRIEVDKVESDKNEDDSDVETTYDTVPSPIRIRFRHSGPVPDHSLYDTVPNPMKYRHSGPTVAHLDQSFYDTVASPQRIRHSGAETADDADDLYDLPPTRRSLYGPPTNVIQMDPETQYLMPISSEYRDSCYVNAKNNRQSFKSP